MRKLIFIFLGLILTSPTLATGDAIAGHSTAIICIGCHSRDGNSTNPEYPILAGQGAAYIAKQLSDFKSGQRMDEHMTSMVEAIGKGDIPNLAAHFSQQQRKPISKDKKDASLGQQIFMQGLPDKGVSACSACHGARAEGNPARLFPALAGQHADYLVKALRDFRDERRQNDTGEVMRMITKKLSHAEIMALAHYLAQLK